MAPLTDVAGWESLREAYQDEGLFLGLGAGLSIESGIPDFDELVRRLAEEQHPGLFEPLRAKCFSLAAIADMVLPSDVRERAEVVREALYREFPYRAGAPPVDEDLVAYVHRTNCTMRAVAALCASPGDRPGRFVANDMIHAIVNFNMDRVFRRYLEERYPMHGRRGSFTRTIERPTQSAKRGKISTFYIHGYLRYDQWGGDTEREAPDAVTVTERSYFDRFNEPTGMLTYAFLHLLREHRGLFVGLSMRDENLRRLLHYSVQERARGFVAKGGRYAEDVADRVVRHFAVMPASRDAGVDGVVKRSLRNLGVQVIRVRSWGEIPRGLETVRGRDEWSTVY